MNILYTNFHGDYGGGQDTYVRDLAAAMSRHHRVTVASPEGSRLSRLLKDSPDVAISHGRACRRVNPANETRASRKARAHAA